MIKKVRLEITSTKLNLCYMLRDNIGNKYTLNTMKILNSKEFMNLHNVEQQFIDWAHNDIANELQGIIDDDSIVMEIRIWKRNWYEREIQ